MQVPANVRSPHSPLELVMLSRDKPLDFEPGSKYLYDNTGYVFLGSIIEKISGEKYGDYLRTHIFDLLEMKDSGYDDTVTILKNRASAYELWATGLQNAPYEDMSLWHAAGAVYSTVRDLYRWDRALYTDKVLTKASLTKLWTPEKNDHGYSWSLQPMAGHKQIGHGGGVIGFESYIARFPDDDACVVVLSNFEGTNPQGLVRELAMVLFGQKVMAPGERPSIKVDSQVLDRYTGVYTNGSRMLTVTNQYGRLTITGSGGLRWQALAASETEFFILEADATYTFVLGEDGLAKELILNDGSRIITLKRK
jgi:CubicO group peptidase (beta-lactamase class C family)